MRRRWTDHTYVIGVAKLDIALEAVRPRHPSAPSTSHLEYLPHTLWEERRAARRRGKQEEAINSWLCREEERGGSSLHRRKYQGNGRRPGGGHGFGAVNSYVFSRLIWDGRDGHKTCCPRPFGRAGSPWRWWLSRTAFPTFPTESETWMAW